MLEYFLELSNPPGKVPSHNCSTTTRFWGIYICRTICRATFSQILRPFSLYCLQTDLTRNYLQANINQQWEARHAKSTDKKVGKAVVRGDQRSCYVNVQCMSGSVNLTDGSMDFSRPLSLQAATAKVALGSMPGMNTFSKFIKFNWRKGQNRSIRTGQIRERQRNSLVLAPFLNLLLLLLSWHGQCHCLSQAGS